MAEDFKRMVGQELDFYGVCFNQFKLGGQVWEAVEDPEDGYRSCLSEVQPVESDGPFFPQPLARVRVEYVEEEDAPQYDPGPRQAYSLVDVADGHLWLEFGTGNWNDYYPCFYFNYSPKALAEQAAC